MGACFSTYKVVKAISNIRKRYGEDFLILSFSYAM